MSASETILKDAYTESHTESEGASMTEYERLRKEFSTAKFHTQLPEKCGTKCINCGDETQIEYHHVVPLELGGTNAFTNIVPLCLTCHMRIHMQGFAKAKRYEKLKKVSGRKRIHTENYKELLLDFFNCRISKSECKEKLGVHGNFADTVWFDEFKKEHGIKRYRNNIDLLNANCNSGVQNGKQVGYIDYKDGRHFVFIWQDGTSEKVAI